MTEAEIKQVIENAVQWAIKIANDNSHGYSQSTRQGNPNYDCTSFVFYAYRDGGGISNLFSGANAPGEAIEDQFQKVGFQYLPFPGPENLQRGDIVLNPDHVELYLGNSRLIGAHGQNPTYSHPDRSPDDGDQGDEISEIPYYDGGWDHILRFSNGETAVIQHNSSGNSSPIPLYKQYDSRWSNVPYGSGTISTSGCGPTCMAMILSWYGKSVTPDVVAKYFREQGWGSSETSHEAFTKGAKHWDIEMKKVSTVEEVKKALLDGSPAIAAHPAGMFTGGGHFIVYAKLSGSDDLIINNPASPNSYDSGPDDKVWSFSTVIADANNDGKGLAIFIPTTSHDGVTPNFDSASNGIMSSNETKQEIKPPPLYKQYDKRWGELQYGEHEMRNSGSGPTCMAMILGWYGKSETPDKVAEYFIQQGWAVDSVTVDDGKDDEDTSTTDTSTTDTSTTGSSDSGTSTTGSAIDNTVKEAKDAIQKIIDSDADLSYNVVTIFDDFITAMAQSVIDIKKNNSDYEIYKKECEGDLNNKIINGKADTLFKKYNFNTEVYIKELQVARSEMETWIKNNAPKVENATFGTSHDTKESGYENSYDFGLRIFYKIKNSSEEAGEVIISKKSLPRKGY